MFKDNSSYFIIVPLRAIACSLNTRDNSQIFFVNDNYIYLCLTMEEAYDFAIQLLQLS